MASLRFVRPAGLALALVFTSWLSVPAEAAHRARLGADLEQTIAQGSQAVDVIVHGTRSEVDALAQRCAQHAEVLHHARLRDRKSTRLNSSHVSESRMPSSA